MDEETNEKRHSGVFIRGLTPEPTNQRLSGIFLNLDFTVLNPDTLEETADKSLNDSPQSKEKNVFSLSDFNVSKPLVVENGTDVRRIPKDEGEAPNDITSPELVPLRKSRNSRSVPNISGLGKRPSSANRLSAALTNVASENNVYIRGISREDMSSDYHQINPYSAYENSIEQQIRLNKRCNENEKSGDNANTLYSKRVFDALDSYRGSSDKIKRRLLQLSLTVISSTFAAFKVGLMPVLTKELNISVFLCGIFIAIFEITRAMCILFSQFLVPKRFSFIGYLISAACLMMTTMLFSIPGLLLNKNSDDENRYHKNVEEILLHDSLNLNESTSCPNSQYSAINEHLVSSVFVISAILHGFADAIVRNIRSDDVRTMFTITKLSSYLGTSVYPHQLGILPGFLLVAVGIGLGGDNTRWWIGSVAMATVSMVIFNAALVLHCRENRCALSSNSARGRPSKPLATATPLKPTRRLKNILSSRVFIQTTVEAIFDVYLWAGFLIFLPIFLETQTDIEPWKTTIAIAFFLGLPAIFGYICGGLLNSLRYKHERKCGVAMVTSSVLSSVILVGMTWLNCDLTIEINADKTSCNEHCVVTSSSAFPVCGSDVTTYFSPCFAGCQGYNYMDDDKLNFTDCTCMNHSSSWAVEGQCPMECGYFVPYLIMLSCVSFLTATRALPTMSRISSIFGGQSKTTQATAQAMHIVLAVSIGSCVSLLLIGGLMTHVFCDVTYDDCGPFDTCWIYDISSIRFIHTAVASSHALAAVFALITFVCVKR